MRAWRRPYRPGVLVGFWWAVFVVSVPITALFGAAFVVAVLATLAGGGDPAFVVVTFVGLVVVGVAAVGCWRLAHAGVWVGDDGIALRSLDRSRRTILWADIEGFDVRQASVSRLLPQRESLHVVLRYGPAVPVPEVWRGSPVTWGGTGVDEILRSLRSLQADRGTGDVRPDS